MDRRDVVDGVIFHQNHLVVWKGFVVFLDMIRYCLLYRWYSIMWS